MAPCQKYNSLCCELRIHFDCGTENKLIL